VSPVWSQNLSCIVETARENGLYVQSLHGPTARTEYMWSADEKLSGPARAELLTALEDCRKLNIPIMVTHNWSGFEYNTVPTEYGIRNYEEIVACARDYGVKIALENTEGEEFLFALMAHFRADPTVGFCWDTGHEMCYNRSMDLLASFGDRLIMTHLNDNLGVSRNDGRIYWTDDLHLLPYDGIADWDEIVARLKSAYPMEYLNFELKLESKPNRHDNDIYNTWPLSLYFAEVYKRTCRIAYRYSR